VDFPIKIVIFHSYVKLPEGRTYFDLQIRIHHCLSHKKLKPENWCVLNRAFDLVPLFKPVPFCNNKTGGRQRTPTPMLKYQCTVMKIDPTTKLSKWIQIAPRVRLFCRFTDECVEHNLSKILNGWMFPPLVDICCWLHQISSNIRCGFTCSTSSLSNNSFWHCQRSDFKKEDRTCLVFLCFLVGIKQFQQVSENRTSNVTIAYPTLVCMYIIY
jgi:hypothetical protein